MKDKIGLTFHEKLQLNRSRIAEVLSAVTYRPGATNDDLRALTSLGTNMTKAFPRLAQGCGLLTKSRHLTGLGKTIAMSDPRLDSETTLWLMHFNLTASIGPGPEFWGYAFKNAIRIGQPQKVDELAEKVREAGYGETIQVEAVREALSRMLGFYTSQDGLGALGLISGSRNDGFSCNFDHSLPAPAPFCYMLASWWEIHFPGQLTLDLSLVESSSELIELLRISQEQLRDLLHQAAEEHYFDLFMSAPPFQIARTWGSEEELLGRIYEITN
jgi:hypothetical protein